MKRTSSRLAFGASGAVGGVGPKAGAFAAVSGSASETMAGGGGAGTTDC
ncbi:hypothetical protein [Sphingorhabdus sp.]